MLLKLKNTRIVIISLLMICFCLTVLTSCGEKFGKTTLYLTETSTGGCLSGSSVTKEKWLIDKIEAGVDQSLPESNKLGSLSDVDSVSYINNFVNLLDTYINDKAVANSDKEADIKDNYKMGLIRIEIENFKSYLANVTTANQENMKIVSPSLNGSAGCLDIKNGKTTLEQLNNVDEVTDIYLLGSLFMIKVDKILAELEPIKFKARTVGEFFKNFWSNIFIFPLAWLLFTVSKLLGGFYIVGLFLVTLAVRTIGWPIYAKTNDMSVKMAALTPELEAIKARYQGKNDPESQRRMQMEQAQLYKKNKIGLGGCLAPLLQFPIFMAVYRAISRIPYTKAIPGTIYNLDWANQINSNFLGIDLFEDRTAGNTNQLIGILILIVLVVGTQVLSQVLTTNRQKKNQQNAQEDIPAYRRQAYQQTQNNGASQMKMMLWFMILMMGVFVWQSKAGLGVYWLIGNLYSMAQMAINNKTSQKKMLEAKNKSKNTVYTIKPEKK